MNNNRSCPYCRYSYPVEAEDYSEDTIEEECEECGKKFWAYDIISVTHYSAMDCELNGEKHNWRPESLSNGETHDFCSVCGECRPFGREEGEQHEQSTIFRTTT